MKIHLLPVCGIDSCDESINEREVEENFGSV